MAAGQTANARSPHPEHRERGGADRESCANSQREQENERKNDPDRREEDEPDEKRNGTFDLEGPNA